MAYRIRNGKSVQGSFRATAVEQIDRSIAEILDGELDRHEAVHQVRKRCKKLRGLFRLVRSQFDAYADENKFFRDAARDLSFVRDAQSTLDCFDDLLERSREHVDVEAFAAVRTGFVERRQQIASDHAGLDEKLDRFLSKMQEARQRAVRWKLHDDGFSAVSGGLVQTFRDGRQTLRKIRRELSDENIHELRKSVKYHGYHAAWLRPIWPSLMNGWRRATEQLAEALGDDHDLAVFHQTLLSDMGHTASDSDRQLLIELIDRRRRELQSAARPLAERLFAEKPKQLGSRLGSYWKVWKATRGDRHKPF
ncbi:MAG: CHAD domain-containing protein [Planctomycetaceae bacterium]|nr:MAG: CHAD domain-containing protein [Planctomycetaceae bacterium]